MHGYKMKKLLDEQVSDFTSIKTSNLYYHLNKMVKEGYIKGEIEPQAEKPNKTIYTITDKGKKEFDSLLFSSLNSNTKFNFLIDNALFFNDYIENKEYKKSIDEKLISMNKQLIALISHKKFTLNYIPDDYKKYSEMIFLHHEFHIKAEIEWLEKIKVMLD
jgi:DNA-binding PadR family transcriptional regulator